MANISTSKSATKSHPARASRASNKERSSGLNRRGAETRDAIVAVTREQIRVNGLKYTNVGTVAEELNIPRPLFYHYFKNIDAVSDVVLLNEVNEYLDTVRKWDAQRIPGDVNDAVDSAIKPWRDLHGKGHFFYKAIDLDGNTELYVKFMRQITDRIARYIIEIILPDITLTSEPLQEKYPNGVPTTGLYELLSAIIWGVNSLLINAPETPDNTIKHILARGLGIEAFLTFEENDGWEPIARSH